MIITWGCQMNEDDSSQMSNLMEQTGYRQTYIESEADVIILNTCSVRAKPEQKLRSKLGELRPLKEQNPDLIIGVCGCMAQREGKALRRTAPFIDIIMGTADITDIPNLIQQVKQGHRKITSLDMPDQSHDGGTSHISRVTGGAVLKAFVPVMYGCNNFCAYCVVPYARGPERSRLPEQIIDEISELVSKGCKEVTLVGQNVNSYGQTFDTPVDFSTLLAMVDAIPGLERIRFTTSHPKDLSGNLIDAMASLPKVCEHLHLPIQSGDDDILHIMGRKYTVERYISLIDELRRRIPDINITTDIMVGFPGETDEMFQNTLATVEKIRYDGAFMFAFNARPRTAAFSMENQIDAKTKNTRLRQLIALQNEMTHQKNIAHEGSVFDVLVEGQNDKDSKYMTGYTRGNKLVILPGNTDLLSQLVRIKAKKAHPWGFTGELVKI
ncbi:MAG: tRNA (N6-isopentenyl adenosine(37)-C2)-methylthiotransferase MiaB [Armatimonadota bacterium]